jgi:P27 family predicted phage terminase small subunit
VGKRGPAPTPNAVKLFEGTYREDRHGGDVHAPPGTPVKPGWLCELAAQIWDERIAQLSEVPGLLSEVDGPALALYCHYWARFHEAQALIAGEGVTCTGEKGGEYQHPAVSIQNKAAEMIAKIGAKFGMTPSDRSGLKPTVKTTDDELSELIA